METQSNRTLLIVVVGLVALLIGCCCGVVIGGLSATLIGVSTIERSESFDVMPELQIPEPVLPEPVLPLVPEAPAVPAPEMSRLSGAYVRDVIEGSPAAEAGVRPGDLIIAVDETPLDANHRLADVLAQYGAGDRITLVVLREGSEEREEVTVRLGTHPEDRDRSYLGVYFMDVAPRD